MNAKRKPQTTDPLADTDEYLRGWAKALVKAAGKREARSTLASYKALAADKQLPKADRDIARRRAKILGEFL